MHDRSRFDPMMKRLKKMRASRLTRSREECEALFHKVKAFARNARLDWIKGKVRWFTETEEFEKIRANLEVEKTMGRPEPQLWRGSTDQAHKYRSELSKEGKAPAKYINAADEQWQHQINPMMLEDLDLYQGQGIPVPKQLNQDQSAQELPEGKEKEDKKRVRRARKPRAPRGRMQGSLPGEDIVHNAESLVEEIRLLCQDDYASSQGPDQFEAETSTSELKMICQDDYAEPIDVAPSHNDIVVAELPTLAELRIS